MTATITIKDYPCGSGKTTSMIQSFKENEKYLVILPELSEIDRVILETNHVTFVAPTTEDNILGTKSQSLKELLLLGRPHLIGIAAHSTNDSPWPVATSNAQSTYGAPCRRGARARRCTWYHYQVPVPLCIAKSRNIRISSWRIHSFATKSRNIAKYSLGYWRGPYDYTE